MPDAISQWALALAAAIDRLRPSERQSERRVDAERRISRITNEARLACALQANGNGGVRVSRSLNGLNRVTGCRQSRVSGQRSMRTSAAELERAAALTMQLSFSEASSKAASRTPKKAPPWWGAATCCPRPVGRKASGPLACSTHSCWLLKPQRPRVLADGVPVAPAPNSLIVRPPDAPIPGKDLAGWRKFSAPSCGNLDRMGDAVPGGEGASEWPSISMSVDGLLPARDRAALHDLGVAAHWKATMRQSRRPNRFNVHLLDVLSVSILVCAQAGLVSILALW